MASLRETVGREALIALAQYQSVTQALAEIIDNPFDYRNNRFLTVEVRMDKTRGLLQILDFGGAGMDGEGLADWIQWGTGHKHSPQDIGQWHVGGKLAAIYLAESLEIVSRRSGDSKIFRFYDPHWGSRTTLYEGKPDQLTKSQLSGYLEIAKLPDGIGFTLLLLRRLKPHRYEKEILISHVANTYRSLIVNNACQIIIDGTEVTPVVLPELTVANPIVISTTKLDGGVTVKGRIWVMDRDRLEQRRGLTLL